MQKTDRLQNWLIFLCFAVYMTAYIGRYSYMSNINLIMNDYGVDKASAGLVPTFFFFGYGAGQFVNGMMCKKYNKLIMFPIVLIGSAAINLSVFFHVPFAAIKYLWLINAVMQSCLWPTIILSVGQYLDEKHIRKSLKWLAASVAVGVLFVYSVNTVFVSLNNYRLTFVLAAVMMTTVAILWLVMFPKIRTLPEQSSESREPEKDGTAAKKTSIPGFAAIFCALFIFAAIHHFILDGLQTWVPTILKETGGMSDGMAIILSLVLPVFGLFGSLLALQASKFIRNLVLLSTVVLGVTVLCLIFEINIINTSTVLSLIFFGLIALLMHTENNIVISLAPLRYNKNNNAGRLAGILNTGCYVGSTVSSYGLGLVAENYGWNAVFYVFVAVSLLAVAAGAVTVLTHRGKGKQI